MICDIVIFWSVTPALYLPEKAKYILIIIVWLKISRMSIYPIFSLPNIFRNPPKMTI